jgi:hypothetical protein
MKKIAKNILFFIFSLTLSLANFSLPQPASAAIDLVKSKDFQTVYYIDGRNIRHPFPDEITYRSWYGNDYS